MGSCGVRQLAAAVLIFAPAACVKKNSGSKLSHSTHHRQCSLGKERKMEISYWLTIHHHFSGDGHPHA
jgi:hypothetical protein